MRPLEGALEVAAKSRVKLNHGDLHLMLNGLKKPLEAEDTVPLTLEFEGGVTLEIELYVEALGAVAGSHDH
jgi:copper(I)-binding protein